MGVFASLDDHADERDLGGAVSESEMEMAGHEAVREESPLRNSAQKAGDLAVHSI